MTFSLFNYRTNVELTFLPFKHMEGFQYEN